MEKSVALFVSLMLSYFLVIHVFQQLAHFLSTINGVFVFVLACCTVLPRIHTEAYCLKDYLFISCLTGGFERQWSALKVFGGQMCVFLCVCMLVP